MDDLFNCTSMGIITFIIYVMIMFGGFVEMWGVDHSFTLKHYIEAFSIDWVKERGLLWTVQHGIRLTQHLQ